MVESPRDRVERLARERTVAEAYRRYAWLVVEHERVRRGARNVGRRAPWEPGAGAWVALRFLAGVHEEETRGVRVLRRFFETHGGGAEGGAGGEAAAMGWRKKTEKTESKRKRGSSTRTRTSTSTMKKRVPVGAWRDAVAAGIDLVAGVLLAHRAELPWAGAGRRVPRGRKEFDPVCEFLCDRVPREEGRPSFDEILEAAKLTPMPPRHRRPEHRVTFYRERHVLSVDGVAMEVPFGRESTFLELLVERREQGKVTPRWEHAIDWKGAVDRLRRRIRKATGQNLLRAVVLPALPPVGGYRLAPGVRVRRD